jgi:hypothetical protein
MAKRATTTRRGRPAGVQGNADRTRSRSNNSGQGRGRRPKSMDEYISEDLNQEFDADSGIGYDDDGYDDPQQLVRQLEQDAEQYDVEAPRVVRRAQPGDPRIGNDFGRANRGRGQNQYTRDNGGNSYDRGNGGRGRTTRSSEIRELLNRLSDLIGE